MTDPTFVDGGTSSLHAGDRLGCVLLHGYTAMPAEMEPLARRLRAAGRTVLSLRLPGHGTHPQHLAETRWHHHVSAAADAVFVLRGLCDRVCVIGTSMGAIVALSPELDVADARVALSIPGEIRADAPEDAPDDAADLVPKDVPLDPTFGIRRERAFPAYGAEPPGHVAEIELGWRRMWEHLPAVTGPVLLAHSDADAWIPVDAMRAVAARLSGAEVETHVAQGLDHAMVLDPGGGEVIALIADFVERSVVGR